MFCGSFGEVVTVHIFTWIIQSVGCLVDDQVPQVSFILTTAVLVDSYSLHATISGRLCEVYEVCHEIVL